MSTGAVRNRGIVKEEEDICVFKQFAGEEKIPLNHNVTRRCAGTLLGLTHVMPFREAHSWDAVCRISGTQFLRCELPSAIVNTVWEVYAGALVIDTLRTWTTSRCSVYRETTEWGRDGLIAPLWVYMLTDTSWWYGASLWWRAVICGTDMKLQPPCSPCMAALVYLAPRKNELVRLYFSKHTLKTNIHNL